MPAGPGPGKAGWDRLTSLLSRPINTVGINGFQGIGRRHMEAVIFGQKESDMMTVKQILDEKGRDVWTIGPDAPVFNALRLMAEKDVGALVVQDKDDILGVISERDYARKIVLLGKTSQETRVSEIMTTSVYGVHPETTAEACMALMTEKRIRHLPVCEQGRLAGIISIGDVVKSIIRQQKFTIEDLQNYIMGKYR